MTFENYWGGMEKQRALPGYGCSPSTRSKKADIKKNLMEKPTEKTVEILMAVIEEINHGSVERVDSIV